MPYLTPQSIPTDMLCRVLIFPNDLDWLAQVTGALQELTFDYNWTAYGSVTPDQAALVMRDMFDRFCFNQGVCRVIGEIIQWAGPASPDAKWLLCDGASLSRSAYPDLFAVIGTAYGAADGSHFNIPDLRGRAPSGAGTGPGLATHALGSMYGEQNHTLSWGEMPQHSHGVTMYDGLYVSPGDVIGTNDAFLGVPTTFYTDLAGGDGAHNTVGPRTAINFLIVAQS